MFCHSVMWTLRVGVRCSVTLWCEHVVSVFGVLSLCDVNTSCRCSMFCHSVMWTRRVGVRCSVTLWCEHVVSVFDVLSLCAVNTLTTSCTWTSHVVLVSDVLSLCDVNTVTTSCTWTSHVVSVFDVLSLYDVNTSCRCSMFCVLDNGEEENAMCPRNETKLFFVISSIKLWRFWWMLVHSFLSKFADKSCSLFPPQLNNVYTIICLCLHCYMLVGHMLSLSCYRKKLQNLSHLSCGHQIWAFWMQLITACGDCCKTGCT